MGKYERRTRPGWVVYHENLPMLEALPPEDVKALVVALTRYSIALANDEPPPNFSSVASPMAQAMCQIMAAKIDRDSEKYRDTAEKRSRKATKADLSQPQSPKADTSQVTKSKSKSKPKPKFEAVAESEAEAGAEATASSAPSAEADRNPSGDCGGLLQEAERRARSKHDNASELDIQRELRNLQHAEQLARKYGLPQNPAVYCSMLDDVEKFGWEKLEDALKEAAAANSRGGLSINFYRAVLQNGAKPTNRGISLSHCRDL